MQKNCNRVCKASRRLIRHTVIFLSLCTQVQAAELALVIDDLGYSHERGLRAIELPGAVTLAVLPFAPHTPRLVEAAAAHSKDIIVHQPMEATPAPHVRFEQGTLTLAMRPREFTATFAAALDAIPSRVGVSNHTGSLLTEHRGPMNRLMKEIDRRGLFFLDSRTTADTVAMRVATEHGVPAITRDVFLDHVQTTEAIHAAFEKSLRIARRRGHAVVIGHPHSVTLDYLEYRLRRLPADVKLVTAAELSQRNSLRTNPPTVLAQPSGLTSLRISPGQ